MDQSKSLFIVFILHLLVFWYIDEFAVAQAFQKSQLVTNQQIKIYFSIEPLERKADTERTMVNKNQISLDMGGLLTHFLSYVRKVGNSNLSIGGGLGFAWELNSHSFKRNIWESLHLVVFGRYQISQILQLDIGPTLLSYYWTDDCSECSGRFVGVHSAAMVGYRFAFFGPCVRAGWADDRKYGSAFGMIWNLQARAVIPWGK